VINGTDILTKFVISGFQSFMSLSAEACKPFDANRTGLTLGEASATLIITKTPQPIALIDGSTSNDANHISGPSRTGEGLLLAINNTLRNNKTPIDFISAHGTATPYNDDMESKAIFRAGLDTVPVNSLKGYFGHTLGSAGVLETIISIEALKQNILINTLGCETVGVAEEIAVIQETKHQELYSLLKLASGFGGGNATALFLKNE
jgi:3-oxoacyl-[acyl-carrier-protein] synthase-1